MSLTEEQIRQNAQDARLVVESHRRALADLVGGLADEEIKPTLEGEAVQATAIFSIAFIYGKCEVLINLPTDWSKFVYNADIWGVGLSGGVSACAGWLEKPVSGQEWTVQITNTPGVVTGLVINFFRNAVPVGQLIGPGLSGGVGMIAGGKGKWED